MSADGWVITQAIVIVGLALLAQDERASARAAARCYSLAIGLLVGLAIIGAVDALSR